MRSIFFDLDDTLYDRSIPFLEAFEEFFHGEYADIAKEAYNTSSFRSVKAVNDRHEGLIDDDGMNIYRYCVGFEDVGIKITPEQALEFQKVYKRMQGHLALSPVVSEIIDYCKAHFDHVGIITNGNGPHQRTKLRSLGLDARIEPDLIVISGETGLIKPDPEVFRTTAKRVPEGHLIFVGDTYKTDIIGAAPAGWTTVWFDRIHECERGAFPAADHIVHSEEELFDCLKKLSEA